MVIQFFIRVSRSVTETLVLSKPHMRLLDVLNGINRLYFDTKTPLSPLSSFYDLVTDVLNGMLHLVWLLICSLLSRKYSK